MKRKRMTSTDARCMRSLQPGYRDDLKRRRKAGEPARCRHPRAKVIGTCSGLALEEYLERCLVCGAIRRGRLKMYWGRWRNSALKVTR